MERSNRAARASSESPTKATATPSRTLRSSVGRARRWQKPSTPDRRSLRQCTPGRTAKALHARPPPHWQLC